MIVPKLRLMMQFLIRYAIVPEFRISLSGQNFIIRKTRPLGLIIFLATGSLSSVAQDATHSTFAENLTGRLDTFLTVQSRLYRFSGSALIARKGTIVLQKSYGWKNVSDSIPNDTSCIYQIGSLTKPFTAEVILKLQELGRISVRDKLKKISPLVSARRKNNDRAFVDPYIGNTQL